jgi:hypothetical protein
MKLIKLTRGYNTKVDDEDFKKLSKYKWHVSINKRGVPSVMTYALDGEKTKHTLMSRMIVEANPKVFVDHKNNDPLDNRRKNLRTCTMSENNRNRRLPKNNTSGYKGVQWLISKQMWVARIKFNLRLFQIGSFKNREDAAMAYNRAAEEFFGEFARKNIIKN